MEIFEVIFFWATLKRSFYFSFCPQSAVRPSVRPKILPLTLPLFDVQPPPSAFRSPTKKTSPDFVPVRPPTSDLGPILYSGANPILLPKAFYSDRGKVRGSLFWSDGRTEITWLDGGRRTADGRKFLLRFRTARFFRRFNLTYPTELIKMLTKLIRKK